MSRLMDLFAMHNAVRTERGLPLLVLDSRLNLAAKLHAERMRDETALEHRFPGEPKLGDRITAAGLAWSRCAENIAAGYTTVRSVVEAWMESRLHRANMLGADFSLVGFNASRTRKGVLYWATVFATPAGAKGRKPRTSQPTGLDRRRS